MNGSKFVTLESRRFFVFKSQFAHHVTQPKEFLTRFGDFSVLCLSGGESYSRLESTSPQKSTAS